MTQIQQVLKFAIVAVLAVVSLAALFMIGLELWSSHFHDSTINNVVAALAARSGISTYLLRGIVVLVTIPFFIAVGRYITYLFSSSAALNPLRMYLNPNGIVIVAYVGAYWLAMYFAGLGSVAGKRYCADTPEGIHIFDDNINDPRYGTPSHLCTTADAEVLAEKDNRLHTATQVSIGNPMNFEFFDSLTGRPKVWYSVDVGGGYRFYDSPGVDPVTGQSLLPVDSKVVADLRTKYQETQARAKPTERPQPAPPPPPSQQVAYSIDPPSNIRVTTSATSAIICSVNASQPIPILGMTGNWYKTNVCGTMGYIYRNQVKF
jgi:hypothetical protein